MKKTCLAIILAVLCLSLSACDSIVSLGEKTPFDNSQPSIDALSVVAEYPCLWKVRIPAGILTYYGTAVSMEPTGTHEFKKTSETFVNGAAVLSDGTTRIFFRTTQGEEKWFPVASGIEVISSSCLLNAPAVHAVEHPHDKTRTCEICGFSLTWAVSDYKDTACSECFPVATNES